MSFQLLAFSFQQKRENQPSKFAELFFTFASNSFFYAAG
jgi:hypothetical protein